MDITNSLISDYLELVEDTESPRIFHIWSLLSGVSAAMGRRAWFPFGHKPLYANLWIMLTGPSAVRKSTALDIIRDLLEENTRIHFGPDNTSGKRQGLIADFFDDDDDEKKEKKQGENLAGLSPLSLEELNTMPTDIVNGVPIIDRRDRFAMMIMAEEFTTFTGHGNNEFVEFLVKLYAGQPYKYKLANKTIYLKDTALTMIGATTPTSLSLALPAAAIGQGFTSRIIFAHASKKYKRIPRPKPLDAILKQKIENQLRKISFEFEGEMVATDEAAAYADSIYDVDNHILTDSRFTYYQGRRHTHFLKIGMVMAATRLDLQITLDDYIMADELLKLTEKTMPDALGEYGMSPIAAAKQRIVEFIHQANEPITLSILHAVMHRDLKMGDLLLCINDLTAADKIQQIRIGKNKEINAYIPKTPLVPDTLQLAALLENPQE